MRIRLINTTRLLIVHQAFASPKDAGGTRHFEFARHLVKSGQKVCIVASSRPIWGAPLVDSTGNRIREQQFDGVNVLRAPALPGHNRSFLLRIFSFIHFMIFSFFTALRAGRQDVVMGTSPPLFQGVTAWLLSRYWRVPFVLEIRDLWPDFAVDMGVLKSPILIRLAKRLEHFLYRRADKFIVNSPAYVDFLAGKGIGRERIELISNGVDPEMFQVQDQESVHALRSKLGLDEKIVVTYAGAIGPANDLGTLIEAAEFLKNEPKIQFLIIGDGKAKKSIEEMVQSRRLVNVTMAGPVPKDEMRHVLALSDVCVAILLNIPMFRMTYPNKVFDYMAAERPVVIAIDGVIRDVVEAANCGIFSPPGNPKELSRAISELCQNAEHRIRLGKNGREYVAKHFNRNYHAEHFKKVIDSVQKRRQ